MIKSESTKELATALAKAQGQMGAAIKDRENPAFKAGGRVTKYADLNAVWDACRGVLTDNGLSVMQMPEDAGEGRIALTTILLHSSGEFIGNTASTRIVKDDPQGVGSAITYLKRYALASFVGVVADEDDDGNAASQPRQQAQQQRPRLPTEQQAKVTPHAIRQAEREFYSKHKLTLADARGKAPADLVWADVCAYLDWSTDWQPETLDDWAYVEKQMTAEPNQVAA